MNTWRWAVALFVIAGGLVNCGEKTYDVTFTCNPGSANCPVGETCPTVPLGAGGCEDLPGLWGHSATHVDSGRPAGCRVSLSYENPAYPGGPQTCTCDASTQWSCPL